MLKKLFIISLTLYLPVVKADSLFTLEKIYGPYNNDISEEFPFVDEDDYIYTDYISSDEIPEKKENRQILEETLYQYKRTKDINYIIIENSSNHDLTIYSLTLYYDNGKLSYDYEPLYFNDNSPNFIMGHTAIKLKLPSKVDQMRLKINIKSDSERNYVRFITGYNDVDYTSASSRIKADYTYYGYNSTYYNNPDIWTTDKYDKFYQSTRVMIYQGETIKYKYRDKLFHTYKLERLHNNDTQTMDELLESNNKIVDDELYEEVLVPNTGI